jgi:hypothetical protein
VAEVVDKDDGDQLIQAVKRLESNPEHRARLAAEALAAGNRFFSHAAGWATFHGALEHSTVAGPDTQGETR